MRVNEKMRKAFSIILCLCILVQNCPLVAFAAGTENLCEHHAEHTAECRNAEDQSACTYHCHICHVQGLVDSLPGEVTAENAEAVAAQLTAIDNEKASLSDEELAQVDFAKYTAAAEGLGSVYAAVPAVDTTCNCETKCAEGSVNSGCAVCGAEGANLSACTGTETTASGVDDWCVVDTEAGTVTIDGTLGGKTTATEEDINALLEAIKGYVDSGITTIIVTGGNPAVIEVSGIVMPAVSEAIYRLSGNGNYDENNPYKGKIDLVLPDVTEIVAMEFYAAFALNSITLPKVTTVGDGAFTGCYYLKKMTFGSVVTSINQSNSYVFYEVGKEVDGGSCDLVLNCGQLQTEDTYKPDLENNVWFKPSWGGNVTWKSITLTHTEGTAATCIAQAVCSVCGESYGEVDGDAHNYGDWVSNGDNTHTRTCANDNTHTENGDCSGGTATCKEQAVCDICKTAYGALGGHTAEPTYAPNAEDSTKHDVTYSCCGTTVTEAHTLDVTTGKCGACGADMTVVATVTNGTNTCYAADAATLNQAVTAILETGSRTFTVELPADAEAGMITAIRRAICDTEGVADGSIHLTLKGVTSIPGTTNWDGVAFGPRNAQWDENNVEIVSHEEVTQLASVNLPDVTEIGAQAFYFCENLVSVSAPKAQTIGAQAFGYTALTSVEFPELTTIPTDMFSGTWTLSSAKFPKVTTIEQGGLLVGAKFTPENNPTPFPLELTAEGDITFNGSNHFNIASQNYSGKVDLVLWCDKKDAVTFHDDGTATWQVREDLSYTFKSITFKHSYVDGKCTACGEDCAHTGGTATCTTLAVCDTCGKEYGELAAHTPDTNGKCTVDGCGYQYAAKVGDTFYETIHKALRAAEGINGCTLILLDNITLTSSSSNASYVNTGTFTLDLNGKTLSSNKRTLEIMGSADLTIRDSIGGGKIVSTGGSAVYLSGDKLTIESGAFEGSLYGVFVSGNYSTVTAIIKGGTFSGSQAMITGFGSNCVIDLTAIDPSGLTLKNNGSGTFAPKLPEGYGMVGSDGKLLTSLSAEQSATVHKHEYKYTDLGDGNHQQACSCGLTTGEPAAHSTTADGDKAANCGSKAYCSECNSEYGDVDKTNHDSSVEYENGFCKNGCYEPATDYNADGVYEIYNAGQLFWFAQQVNEEGNKEIKGTLRADIDLENRPWTPIGAMGEENSFRGVFDGLNYIIRGLNVEGSENGVGFFGEVRTGTVRNFTIYGNVVVNTEVNYVGGVIGSICGVNSETDLERNGAIIQNITSFVNVTAKAHGVGMIGGFVGHADHQSLIEQCSWYGTFDAGEYRVDSGAGGFIGEIQENTSEVTIRNCGAYGTIKTNYAGDYNNTATIYMGGFLSFSNTGAKTTLENCLFAGRFERGANLTDEARLGAFGTLRSVNAIKNCYYLGDDGLAAVHSDSDLKPGSDNVEITSVTEDDLRNNTIATQLGDLWEQGEHYPVLKRDGVEHSHSYTYADNGDGTHDKVCDICRYVEVDNEAHTGGTATCTTQAVCEACGASYGELNANNHNWENGVCTYECGTTHDPHTWESGTCTVCGLVCTHESFENGKCTLCGISFMEGYGPDSDDSEFGDVSGTAITSSDTSVGTSWSDETGKGNLNFRWGAGDALDVTAVISDETVAYEKTTVQPHLSDAHWMQFPLEAAYGEETPVIAARGFDEYFHEDFVTGGTGSVANVFTQTASGDPGFLSGDMLMYGTTNGTASVEFKHIPAVFRFVITNTHGEALTLDSVTLRVVDADGTPVAAASKACEIKVEAGDGYQESFSGYGTYDAVTTNITGGTLEPGQSYLAYALALPLGKADTGKPDENAFKDKTIQVTVTTSEGVCIAFELAADDLARANPGNDYNWVGGKSYTMRMGTRCADGCTFDATGKCTLCGYQCDHDGAEYKDNGDGTHDKVCGECGYVEVDNEAHTLTYTAKDNVITESCSANCGYSGTAAISATGKTYDGTAVEVIVSKTGSLENTDIPVTLTKDGEAFTGEPVNAGAYTASITLGDKTVSVDFTIAKADVGITAPTPNTLTYSGDAQYLISTGEAVGGTMVYSLTEEGEYTTSIPQGTNAGDYKVWYYVQGDANHNDSAKDSVDVTIAKAEPRAEDFVFQSPDDLSYNGESKTASVSVQDGIVGMGEIVAVMYYVANPTREQQPISAGNYFVQINVGEGENYTAKSFFGGEDWVFTIAPKMIYIAEANLADVVRNDSNSYDLTVTSISFLNVVNGDTLTLGEDYTATAEQLEITGGNLTGYQVKAKVTVTLLNSNYTLGDGVTHNTYANIVEHEHDWKYTANGATITATCNAEGCPDAEQSITISAVGKTYDGTPVTATLTGSIDGVATPEITYTGNTNAGTHTASITVGEVTASVEFTIEKATVTVTADAKSKPYGTDNPTLTYTSEGLLGDDVLTGALETTATKTSNVGEYDITVGSLANSNYTIDFVGAKLTINAKAITVTADALSKTYGDADPKLTYKVDGLVNGDELTGELKRAAGENIGSYDITQNTLTAGGNYTITYTGAKLTINAKAITAADVKLNGSLTYNGKEQSQPTSVTEGISYEVSGNKATDVGTYELTIKGTGNYTGSVTLSWTIAKAKLTITADSKVIYIGEKLPTLTYTASGLVGGDKLTKEPVLTSNADADQAGSYTITAANADAGENYTITYVSGSLTIMDKETKVETKIVQTELTEVPEGLKNTPFNTVEAITEELVSRILAVSTGYSEENMVHYDVALQFSLDGGNTWIYATEENFPTEGIVVVLPYPEGTNARDYEFVVSHMFTVTSQRLGTVAGEVELPKVEETANGISVILKGLSPVTVAARYHDHTGGTATCTDKAICSVCSNAYGEPDPDNHAGGTEVKNAKEATCGAEGYTGDTHCKGCGEITEKGTAVKATGEHTYGDWKVVKKATKTEKGVKQRTCSVCSHVDSEEIPTLSDIPATRDDFRSMLYSSMIAVSFAGLIVLLLAAKKRKQNCA